MMKGIQFGIGAVIGAAATIIVMKTTKINGVSIMDVVRNAVLGIETNIDIEA